MDQYQITLDIYCEAGYQQEPVYRIYVDQDLLTERTWSWPRHEQYIQEVMTVNLESGTHQVRVEPLLGFAGFVAKNLTVNGVAQHQQDLLFVV